MVDFVFEDGFEFVVVDFVVCVDGIFEYFWGD